MYVGTRVAVVGGGVIGMSTAVRLQEGLPPGAHVTVLAEHLSPHTTGDGAAGFWEPYQLGDTPVAKIRQWGGETKDHLNALARSSQARETGTFFVTGHWVSTSANQQEPPDWHDQVIHFREMNKQELDLYPGRKFGFSSIHVMAECKHYLPWLMKRFQNLGGQIIQQKVDKLSQLYDDYDVVVNCAGLGGGALAGDPAVVPIKGQLIKVEAPWVKHFVITLDPDENLYILVGSDAVSLGGTADAGNDTMHVDPVERQRVWDGCCRLDPSLKTARVVGDWVGLRPGRSSVRLELEHFSTSGGNKLVVHNYGHGGGGITLHWGCAREVLNLVSSALSRPPTANL